ncbi:MAG: type II toxin-antitoxin system RelE/ParE family toxin [Candidatus Marinimicrobia bacterium]|nr:type II toxin-antitoxin system RelE/ParE family toxin [Candidatus Neomarinimicrobiota bacterium]MBL7009663.1 type II toxin-antitoxin system RelE/ParE family toxin [Candidatus Neomarinimicrobiota bacterium]MBL7029594.1 type II toxin-antitoxin system RelE/ParE family toxin [Candidatus Neomarinimicrobiota bacterium]
MIYRILFKPSAFKQGKKLPKKIQSKIREAIDKLKTEPRKIGCKKLRGTNNLYRVRVGDYRIVYEIEDDRLIILVLKIAHRKDIYR